MNGTTLNGTIEDAPQTKHRVINVSLLTRKYFNICVDNKSKTRYYIHMS